MVTAKTLDIPFQVTHEKNTIEIMLPLQSAASAQNRVIKIETLALVANMVVLMALVLATPVMPLRKKAWVLPLSVLFLFCFHLFSVLIIIGAHGIPENAAGVSKMVKAVSFILYSFSEQIGKIVMPFILWLLFAHSYVFGKMGLISAGPSAPNNSAAISDEGQGPERELEDEEQGLEQELDGQG